MNQCPCSCLCDCLRDGKTQIILYPQQIHRSTSTSIKRKLSTKRMKINNSIQAVTRISQQSSTQTYSLKNKHRKSQYLPQILQNHEKENTQINVITSRTNNANQLASYTSNRSIKTIKNAQQKSERNKKDITIILLEKQNIHLKDELDKLKKEEADLLRKQRNIKDRNSRQINHLTNVSDDLRRKSLQRKKEMEELKELLKWRKSYNKTNNIPLGKKQKNKQKLNNSIRATICATLSTKQKQI